MNRALAVLALGMLLGGCATPGSPASDATQAKPVATIPAAPDQPIWIDVTQLRPLAHFTTGSEPLYLKVSVAGGKVVAFDSTGADDANLVVRFSRHDETGTMVVLESKLDAMLKLDLHISPDAQHYLYTSSCPIIANGADYEQWPHAVAWLAVSNPRVVDSAHATCH